MLQAQRNSFIYFGLLSIVCLGLGIFLHLQGIKTNDSFDDLNKTLSNARTLSETADTYRFEVVGLSMYPTLKDGATYRADKHAIPKVDDIIAFKCLVERCQYEEMVKFVRSIDKNGCYNVQGRDDVWKEEDGEIYASFDSSDFGNLCPGEIYVNGVVR